MSSSSSASQPPRKPHASAGTGNYGRMLVLGKGRAGSGGASAARPKMAVPKPVNLPSRKAETGGITPLATPLGVTGWSKDVDGDGGGRQSAWGDTPAPHNNRGGAVVANEFPALGQDEEEYFAERQKEVTARYSNLRRDVDDEGVSRRNYSEDRGWGSNQQRGVNVAESPPRVEPGAFVIKKRGESESSPRVQQQQKQQQYHHQQQHQNRPSDRKDEIREVIVIDDESGDEGLTSEKGKIVWSLESEEMDFSRPLRFGDEDEERSRQAVVVVADEGGGAYDDVELDGDTYVPTQDFMDSEEEDVDFGRAESVNNDQSSSLSYDTGVRSDVSQNEQANLEERRRQIMARHERELSAMRAMEEERENQRRELDRLRREEDARHLEEKADERRAVAERESERAAQKDYTRGRGGEVRTLFNPKDPDRPIIVKPGAKLDNKADRPERKGSHDRAADDEKREMYDRYKDKKDRKDRPQAEKEVPYRSSRSLVEPGAVVVSDRKPSKNQQGQKGRSGNAPNASSSATNSGAKDKKKGSVDERKILVTVVVAPPPPPVVPLAVWEKPQVATEVKTLAEIQEEERQREIFEENRRLMAAVPVPLVPPTTSLKKNERSKKKKKEKQALKRQEQRSGTSAGAPHQPKIGGGGGGAKQKTERRQKPSGNEEAVLDVLVKAELPSLSTGGLATQQRRLFERGPEEDDVIDTFHLERGIDAVTEEGTSDSQSGKVRANSQVPQNVASSRFTESSLSASAFTPKFGGLPSSDPSFQSTWAPQTSQLDTESLYSGTTSGRYSGLFGGPASGSQYVMSPFAASFGQTYGNPLEPGSQWGVSPSVASGTPSTSLNVVGSQASTSQNGKSSSSRFFPEAAESESLASWTSPSVFALPSHVSSSSGSTDLSNAAAAAVAARSRQPLASPSNPEEFGRFLERATFTPSSQTQGKIDAAPSIGGKPLSTLAATPAYVIGGSVVNNGSGGVTVQGYQSHQAQSNQQGKSKKGGKKKNSSGGSFSASNRKQQPQHQHK